MGIAKNLHLLVLCPHDVQWFILQWSAWSKGHHFPGIVAKFVYFFCFVFFKNKLRIYKITNSFQNKNCERIISKQLLKQHCNFKLQNHYVFYKPLCSNKTLTTIHQTRKKYALCYQWSMGELENKQFRRFLKTQQAPQSQTAPEAALLP